MTEQSMKISSDATSHEPKNVQETLPARTVGRKATITKEELFQAQGR